MRYKPCPMNPPLSPAARRRVEAALAAYTETLFPHQRLLASAEAVHALSKARMAAIDLLPRSVRQKIHERGRTDRVLRNYLPPHCKAMREYRYATKRVLQSARRLP